MVTKAAKEAIQALPRPAGECYLSVADIAARLGLSTKGARQIVRTQMRRLKWGKEYRVAESEFQRWIDEHTSATSSPVGATPSAALYKGSDPAFWDK